jgi:hypothetical protein
VCAENSSTCASGLQIKAKEGSKKGKKGKKSKKAFLLFF